MLEKLDARVLFGRARSLDAWNHRLDRDEAVVETWTASRALDWQDFDSTEGVDARELLLPLAWHRRDEARVFDDTVRLGPGDRLSVVLRESHRSQAEGWLSDKGLERLPLE
jgi:hypothetical protein